MPAVHDLLDRLWDDYQTLNPQARAIHQLLRARGEQVVNDHIALRTFADSSVRLDSLAAAFEKFGYEPKGDYLFPEKRLFARHFEHADSALPRVFISELKVGEFTPGFQEVVARLVEQVPADLPSRGDFAVSGRPWRVTWEDYDRLRAESEYGAWMAAFGFRANHFTVLVNALKAFADLESLNAFLKKEGFPLNSSGGEIKGSPAVFLEQSSTLADQVEVQLSDGARRIPACYYEFARRYRMPNGLLYSGFVEKSADKIFESTDTR